MHKRSDEDISLSGEIRLHIAEQPIAKADQNEFTLCRQVTNVSYQPTILQNNNNNNNFWTRSTSKAQYQSHLKGALQNQQL